MKPLIIAAALAAATVGAAAPAFAQVNVRQDRQAERIQQGLRTGELRPGEARRLNNQQASIAHQEYRMRERNGGHLTRWQRDRLAMRQDRASRHIYRAKHNLRVY